MTFQKCSISDRSPEAAALRPRLPRPEEVLEDEAERHHHPVGLQGPRRQEGVRQGQEGRRRIAGHLQVRGPAGFLKLLHFLFSTKLYSLD